MSVMMLRKVCCFVLVGALLGFGGCAVAFQEVDQSEVVVRLFGGPAVARAVANEMGYIFKGPVSACAEKLLACLNIKCYLLELLLRKEKCVITPYIT